MMRSRWSSLPRAAAALLALLLSVVAGPRGNADDRRADGPRGGAAQVAPIHPLVAVVARPLAKAQSTPVVVAISLPLVAQSALRCLAVRPLSGTPVAARAP